jgi:hypothetical protein
MGARIVTAPRHAEVCAGDHESQSNIQPPSFCWPASEQIEMSLDLLIAEEGARSAPGAGERHRAVAAFRPRRHRRAPSR